MDGDKTGMALGVGTFSIGGKDYDTKLGMDDVRKYIKKIKSFSLRINHYNNKEDIEKVDSISNELLDFKESFVREALVRAGMDGKESLELVGFNYTDVIKDGAIESWLGLISKKDSDDKSNLKN